jgi:hypothetical protein
MLPFISHHVPTAAQAATVRDRFGQLVCTDPIVFEPGSVVAACWRAVQAVDPAWTRFPCPRDHDDGCDCTPTVAGVFPGWALLELVRAGWAVVEFVNEPGARQRGAFVCRGAFVHTLRASDFVPCPVPVADQEDGPLLAGLRSAPSAP